MSKILEFIKNMSAWYWVAIVGVVVLVAALIYFLYMRKKKSGGAEAKADDLPHTELPSDGGDGPVIIGKVHEQGARDYQEDSFSVSPEEMYPDKGLLAVLADGMGGLGGGDKVSQTAVTAIMNRFYVATGEGLKLLLDLLKTANGAVNKMLGIGNIGKSGSTLACGYLKEDKFYYINVGDSRICLFRDGILYQLNREHNYRNELALRAVNGDGTLEGAWSHPKASGLTSFIGMGQIKYLDIPAEPVSARPGDMFILMSDGVYNAISKEELSSCLSGDATAAAESINAMVKEKAWPGQDNYTAIILQYNG